MKRLLMTFAVLLLTLDMMSQKMLMSHWQHGDDSVGDSLTVLDYLYDKEGEVFYRIANDSTSLYVQLMAMSDVAKRKILHGGLSVWIDSSAKNKRKQCILFPVNSLAEGDMERGRYGMRQHKVEATNTLLPALVQEIGLKGFSSTDSIAYVSAVNDSTVNGIIKNTKDHRVLYALIIPYHCLGVDYSPGFELSVNVRSKDMSQQQHKSATMSMGASRQGGGQMQGAGRPGGMRGGGMNGGASPMREQMGQQRAAVSSSIRLAMKKVKLK